MKFAFSTNAFRKYGIEESIRKISTAGYNAVELMCDRPHAFPPLSRSKINSIKHALEENKMVISNLNGFMMCAIKDFHHPSWIDENPDYRQQRINHTIHCLELARDLGVKTVSTEPGGPLDGLSRKNALDIFKQGLDEVLPVAQKTKVKLLIEPEPGLLIETSSQFLKFISQFNTKYLGLNFDIGHFYCVKEDPSKLIKLLKDYISHIHLEDISENRIHRHLIPGKGAIDFAAVFTALREIDYGGFVTIELYPYQDNPEHAAREAMKFLTSLKLSC